jgi:hypothetical protein
VVENHSPDGVKYFSTSPALPESHVPRAIIRLESPIVLVDLGSTVHCGFSDPIRQSACSVYQVSLDILMDQSGNQGLVWKSLPRGHALNALQIVAADPDVDSMILLECLFRCRGELP